MAWLDDHPPATAQFRCPRRAKASGVVVVHTAENTADVVGPDAGAEAVANFIRTRSTPGSYHDLCDSDSRINLVRYSCEAFHVAVDHINWHAYGVSAACEADRWALMPDLWRAGCVANMAAAARSYAAWLFEVRAVRIPATRITRVQAVNGVPGFIGHGDLDPTRRHDPGVAFPWAQFLNLYRIGAGQVPPPPSPPLEDDMQQLTLVQQQGNAAWYATDGITKRWVRSREEAGHLRVMCHAVADKDGLAFVFTVDEWDLSLIPTVGDVPPGTGA